VSPKAIFVREHFSTIRNGVLTVVRSSSNTILEITGASFRPGQLAGGDYYLRLAAGPETERRLIVSSAERTLAVDPQKPFRQPIEAGAEVHIQVRLQRPQVDPERCIGCGVCEHGCPVAGRRAIRVSAENESRNKKHRMLSR
jgi:hypothetical protein